MKLRLFTLSAVLLVLFGCDLNKTKTSKTEAGKSPGNASSKNAPSNTAGNNSFENGTPNPERSDKTDNSVCLNLKRRDLSLDKTHTFAIDFRPFENSCFVTFHSPGFDDPPLGSQFFIYKNGQEIFTFPDQFGSGNTVCWVVGVAFEDLNDDQLNDIIVVGKCGSKSSSYNENMVYINTGKGFDTNAESNAETMDFSKIAQIRDFVKKNPKMFIP